MASRNDIEIIQEGVHEFLQGEEMAGLNQYVAELIMSKDKLKAPVYSYEDMGVVRGRQQGGIFRDDDDAYYKEVKDGKLKKAGRSRLGELGEP